MHNKLECPVGRLMLSLCTQTTFSLLLYHAYSLTDTFFVANGVGGTASGAVGIFCPGADAGERYQLHPGHWRRVGDIPAAGGRRELKVPTGSRVYDVCLAFMLNHHYSGRAYFP